MRIKKRQLLMITGCVIGIYGTIIFEEYHIFGFIIMYLGTSIFNRGSGQYEEERRLKREKADLLNWE